MRSLISSDPFADWESPERKLFGLLPAEGQQLLSTANSAWVFGGMGWWNDMSFEGETQQQYDELSDRLYQLLNEAVVTGVNTSYCEQL